MNISVKTRTANEMPDREFCFLRIFTQHGSNFATRTLLEKSCQSCKPIKIDTQIDNLIVKGTVSLVFGIPTLVLCQHMHIQSFAAEALVLGEWQISLMKISQIFFVLSQEQIRFAI